MTNGGGAACRVPASVPWSSSLIATFVTSLFTTWISTLDIGPHNGQTSSSPRSCPSDSPTCPTGRTPTRSWLGYSVEHTPRRWHPGEPFTTRSHDVDDLTTRCRGVRSPSLTTSPICTATLRPPQSATSRLSSRSSTASARRGQRRTLTSASSNPGPTHRVAVVDLDDRSLTAIRGWSRYFAFQHATTSPVSGIADGAQCASGCGVGEVPETRYAAVRDADVAYQVFGRGPVDVVQFGGWASMWSCVGRIRSTAVVEITTLALVTSGFERATEAFSLGPDLAGTPSRLRVRFTPHRVLWGGQRLGSGWRLWLPR